MRSYSKVIPSNVSTSMKMHLHNCGIPKENISILLNEKSNIVTVKVNAPHGTLSRNYSAFQLLNGNPYVVDEMVKIALWYHGPEPMPERPHWWHSKSLWQQVVWLWFAGFTLVVILSIAKTQGWYK